MKSIKDVTVQDKRVLLRADLDIPIENGTIVDDTRIKAALETIKYLLKRKAKVIIAGHLGRPDGKINEDLRMLPVAARLSRLLKKPVNYQLDCIGNFIEQASRELNNGQIMLLENIRFHKEEEQNSKAFAKKLASLADIYVNDAFATSHRKHASIDAITYYLKGYAGLQFEKEVKTIKSILKKPKNPYIAIIGGVKITTKIGAIKTLLKKVDAILLGGAMIFAFYKALGKEIGTSICDKDNATLAKTLLKLGKKKIILPTDIMINTGKTVSVYNIPKNASGLDIGPETQQTYSEIIKKAKTIIWNGPMGKFEYKKFEKGTKTIAQAIAKSKATSLVGGGNTEEAVKKFGLTNKYNHVSTGGGAMLELIEKEMLAGIKALERKNS
ncbi:phosphoglycerate kinase [Candidatus Woesearchaeota archaeon CG10_big_fil_rev_8_21_14_0_10_37_12]|nr:MAG: phosphoglycerate kinase [Candidatus Woesearchaeota archaeon CG10_big_fil_rev_8_21_14_0_10_37_12]